MPGLILAKISVFGLTLHLKPDSHTVGFQIIFPNVLALLRRVDDPGNYSASYSKCVNNVTLFKNHVTILCLQGFIFVLSKFISAYDKKRWQFDPAGPAAG